MERCVKEAYAKINLCLDVTGRLPNGYHQVRMIMQTVGIHDTLSFERTEGEIQITADGGELPLGPENLIYKAILLMRESFGITGGAKVHLEKRIPIAAGLAGGSTDAACTLKAMNELYELGLPEQKLMELGVRIGADVPYCIMGGTALAEGIGEKLTQLSCVPWEMVLLVAKPEVGVSTKEVYQALDSREILGHPDVDGMLHLIGAKDTPGIAHKLGNVLETVTVERYPIVGAIKERMLEGGALGSLMSGSGPTVFGIFESEERAREVGALLERQGLAAQSFVTHPVNTREADGSEGESR